MNETEEIQGPEIPQQNPRYHLTPFLILAILAFVYLTGTFGSRRDHERPKPPPTNQITFKIK